MFLIKEYNVQVWNRYENIYERLWVQKVSLKPTRDCVIEVLKTLNIPCPSFLDMSCGTGQLLDDLNLHLPNLDGIGVEPSRLGKLARKKGHKVIESMVEDFSLDTQFGCVLCTHAFPYYTSPKEAIASFSRHTLANGYLILAHAETKRLYDRIALALVKCTTSKANYPTPTAMLNYLQPYYEICNTISINAWYIPSITLYVARKR
jgi:SAM-dependent methyltransferase